MNGMTIAIGAVALCYGVFSAVMRKKKPEYFRKLEPMKRRFGDKAGNTLHFFGYVIVPVLAGVVLILSGLNGASLF